MPDEGTPAGLRCDINFEAGATYIHLVQDAEPVARTVAATPVCNIDYDATGTIIGIELLNWPQRRSPWATEAARLAAYSGEPLCPRCGNGMPTCASGRWHHQETCARYRWARDVCDDCKTALLEQGDMDSTAEDEKHQENG